VTSSPNVNTAADDARLDALVGTTIASSLFPGVTYRVIRVLSRRSVAVKFLAVRDAQDGGTLCVLKMLRPSFVVVFGALATTMVTKECVALGRLNDRAPPSPFVVRLIETGTLPMDVADRKVDLPWLALEHVHGGAEGATLEERIAHSVRTTGAAFDAPRAARAIEQIAGGLAAVHGVGVVHRDVKPENVLACGVGEDEVLKISDFGLARPAGVSQTFGGIFVGTPGHAAPELAAMDPTRVGPWTDVFSAATVFFEILAGTPYLEPQKPGVRRALLDAAALSPELRARPDACRAIDQALAMATSTRFEERPQSIEGLAAMVVPWLRNEIRQRHSTARIRVERGLEPAKGGWSWRTPWRARGDMLVRQVAWESDGTSLALTDDGLASWTGTEWRLADAHGLDAAQLRFARRVGAGRWLLGVGEHLAVYTRETIGERFLPPAGTPAFDLFDGDLDDLAVLSSRDETAALHAVVARRWLKACPVPDATTITSFARVDEARWIVTGRRQDAGVVAIYAPLDWSAEPIATRPVRAFLASAGNAERRMGVAVGTQGAVVTWDEGRARVEEVPGVDLSAVAIDPAGRAWAAGRGSIWRRDEREWTCAWRDPEWQAPFVALFADVGRVIAIAADGGVLEGSADLR
jgi:serine/threonine protein kinase